jgi:putative chitinase
MITRDDLKKFARHAKPAYVDALMAGMETLREAGILESEYRLCHFMAQVGHETGGFTIIRENMNYRPSRAREVWPKRFRNMPYAELRKLCADPVRFSDSVYGGRMGNRKGTADGFNFRGAGFIQTTGRYAFEKYATKLGLPKDDENLARYAEDLGILLKFAALEWKESGCNEWSDENDLTKVCKAINTGSATSNIKPVGMTDRQKWFAKAWSIWGDKGKPDFPADPVNVTAPTAVAGGAGILGGSALLADPVGLTSTLVAVKGNTGQLLSGVDLTSFGVPLLILALAVGVFLYARRQA